MAVDAPAFGFGAPFEEQLAFFRQKLNLPTERWDDIVKQAHDKAFIVAGAADTDLLQDLRAAIDKSIAEGKGIEAFRKDFKHIVKARGWTGWTGQGTVAGEAWRTKIIYQTNMATSYAAGRYKQLTNPDFLALNPNWEYVHDDSVMHPRPLHLSWNKSVLPYDHPFWATHFPPNGWGCHCYVRPRPKGYALKYPHGWEKTDPVTGVQVGIDKGFDYAPGASSTKPLQSFIDDKLIKLDAPIGAMMWKNLEPVINLERQFAWWESLSMLAKAEHPDGGYTVLSAMTVDVIEWLALNSKPNPISAEIAVPNYLPFGTKQLRHLNQHNALTLDDWRSLPMLLSKPGAIYYDKPNNTLIYVAEEIGPTKIIVEFDPIKTSKKEINFIKTAYRLSEINIADELKIGNWEIVEVSGRR